MLASSKILAPISCKADRLVNPACADEAQSDVKWIHYTCEILHPLNRYNAGYTGGSIGYPHWQGCGIHVYARNQPFIRTIDFIELVISFCREIVYFIFSSRPSFIPLFSQADHQSFLFVVLGKIAQQHSIKLKNPMQIGWSTKVPALCATKPVRKGTIAPPLLPAEAMKLIAIT